MAVTTRFPTANEVEATGWTNPNNAHVDDSLYATCGPGKNSGISTRWTTFGFDGDIPVGATITAVKIIYEYKVTTTASVATARVRARINDVDQASHDDTSEPLVDTIITVDITADRSWVRADLLDAALKITVDGRRGNSNNGVTFNLDQVKVEVTYTTGQDQIGNATLPSSGVVQSIGALLLAATVAFSSPAALSATGTVATTHNATAALSSIASLSSTALVNTTHEALAALASSGSVQATGVIGGVDHVADASLLGASTLEALADTYGRSWYAGKTFLLSTMPTAAACSTGSFIFVSDAPAGEKFKGNDGTQWVNLE